MNKDGQSYAYELLWQPPNILVKISKSFWRKLLLSLEIPIKKWALRGVLEENTEESSGLLKTFSANVEKGFGFSRALKFIPDKETKEYFALSIPLPRALEKKCPSCGGTGKNKYDKSSCGVCDGAKKYFSPDWKTLKIVWLSCRTLFMLLSYEDNSFKKLLEINFPQLRGDFFVNISPAFCSWIHSSNVNSCAEKARIEKIIDEMTFPDVEKAMEIAYGYMVRFTSYTQYSVRSHSGTAGIFLEINDLSNSFVLMPQHSLGWQNVPLSGLRLVSCDLQQPSALAMLAGLAVLFQQAKPAIL